MLTDQINNQLRMLATFLAARAVRAWLVGGGTRDLLLGRVLVDLDLAVDGDGLALARAYADACGGSFVALDSERGTGRVVITTAGAPLIIDLVQLRAATIEADLALRDVTINGMALPLMDGGRWTVDAGSRGNTDGEVALPSTVHRPPSLIDPLGGYDDLLAGRLRACGPTSMADDPLRILRVVRLAAALGFQIDSSLELALRAAALGIEQVAAERVRDELLKLLDTSTSADWLRYLDAMGVLTRIFPELEPARACDQPRVHFLPVLAHSLETVAALDWLIDGARSTRDEGKPVPPIVDRSLSLPVAVQSHPELSRELPYAEQITAGLNERRGGGVRRAVLLKLAALLHDNAKPQTKVRHPDGSVTFYGHQEQGTVIGMEIAQRLRLGRADVAYVGAVVREHMRPGQIRASGQLTRRAVVRLFRDAGDAGADVLLHELADHLATRGPNIDLAGWLAHLAWVELVLTTHYERPTPPPEPLLRGDALMAELGIGPGPQLGAILREIAEAYASGELTERDEALALARQLLAEASSGRQGDKRPGESLVNDGMP